MTTQLLKGQTALITGGLRGIGLAIAKAFAEAGANLLLTSSRDIQHSQDIIDELRTYGHDVKAIHLDITSRADVQSQLLPLIEQVGGCDILVSNAGITRDGLLLRMSEQAWDDVMQVDLKAAFNVVQAVLPGMMRKRKGSIIAISSVVGLAGNAGQANYAAAKAGLIALMQSLAKEMGGKGIRANCIAPGVIETDMTAHLPEAQLQQYKQSIPLKRFGQPEEVAQTALFLASDMASYITGQTIACCGGMS